MGLGGAVLELWAKLGLDSKEFDNGLGGAKNKFASFSKVVSGIGKVGAAAFAAVGTATVAMGKQAVDAFGEYEQLEGGINKIFEGAANTVIANSEKAYLTAGMSANEYMKNVTGIASALKRSMGDDLEGVAELSDVAMRVISDNVSTFGSDMEFVTNAVMGLSRNNFTMIDNLKLGYAGSAEGMRQLINDSGVLGRELTSTSELATVGFDKMILAIQKIQEKGNIAGTTLNEALSTFEGSSNATAKAWQNVITAIGRGEGLDTALDSLSTAIFGTDKEGTGFLSQIIPRIEKTMKSIGDFVVKAGPMIAEKVPEVLGAILPTIFETITSLTGSLAEFIFEKLPDIVSTLSTVVQNIFGSILTFIMENLPSMLQAGIDILHNIAEGIRNNLPEIIATATEMIASFLEMLYEKAPEILAAGVDIIVALVEGLIASIPDFVAGVGRVLAAAVSAFNKIDWLGIGKSIIDGIVRGITRFGSKIGDTLKSLARSAWKAVKSFFGISSPSKLMRDTIGKFIPLGMAEGIEDEADAVDEAMNALGNSALNSVESPLFTDDFTQTRYQGSISSPSSSNESKQLTVILELDRYQLGRAVYKLNNEETQRVGVRLAGAY